MAVQELESGTYMSARGTPVTVVRVPTPDDPHKTKQLWISYGKGGQGGKGRVSEYPDNEFCRPRAREVFEWFMGDCDNLGTPFKEGRPGAFGRKVDG